MLMIHLLFFKKITILGKGHKIEKSELFRPFISLNTFLKHLFICLFVFSLKMHLFGVL